jgi:predicted transcriptional regulator
VAEPVKKKKQTPEEIEAEMRRLREAQEKHREEMKARAEEARKKRLEDKAKERERKREEKRIVAELMQSWTRRRDDLECEDLKGRCYRCDYIFYGNTGSD